MKGSMSKISVFEHESIFIHKGENRISEQQLLALQKYAGSEGTQYFSLIHNGIRFTDYVGVIQVGNLIIEVLPKADKGNDVDKWRSILIGMLQAVGTFKVDTPSSSLLELYNNSVLELYYELFLTEVEYLVRTGLFKQYRKIEGNLNSVKGSIQFRKHITKNLIHRERFYTRYSAYDTYNLMNSILWKALIVIKILNQNTRLTSRINRLLMIFPEFMNFTIDESTFQGLVFNRKNEKYRYSIEIARLILLNYHPDMSKGINQVLALMFDMNLLWENFVYVSLRKSLAGKKVVSNLNKKYFWKPTNGRYSVMKPDIVINKGEDNCIVLDAKWKNLKKQNPSPNDLRQMYVYSDFYSASIVGLVYPSEGSCIISGYYSKDGTRHLSNNKCCVISIASQRSIHAWQKQIGDMILALCGLS